MAGMSKAQIDKSGNAIARGSYKNDLEYIELEYVFDDFRKEHLNPLTKTTLELQQWLVDYGCNYYIAQRLKRKPQIIRKLLRFSTRLTQLQDIGGCRIIVGTNKEVSALHAYIVDRVKNSDILKILNEVDYREKGRDDSGYRALHIVLQRDGYKLELQIRSRIQHYWAESIERTSVIYGYHLKEQEGDAEVIAYFKKLSGVFYEIESGREPTALDKLKLDYTRKGAERVIQHSDRKKVFESYVNEGIIKTMTSVQGAKDVIFSNWIIVFDWNIGSFVQWEVVGRDPDEAMDQYTYYERQYSQEHGFEVVLIGSSSVSTIKETHSHYFGIERYDSILEDLDNSVLSLSRRMDIDVGARQILLCMSQKRYWGRNTISVSTLKNHYCKGNLTFDSSLRSLIEKEYINISPNGSVSLILSKKSEIAQYF